MAVPHVRDVGEFSGDAPHDWLKTDSGISPTWTAPALAEEHRSIRTAIAVRLAASEPNFVRDKVITWSQLKLAGRRTSPGMLTDGWSAMLIDALERRRRCGR